MPGRPARARRAQRYLLLLTLVTFLFGLLTVPASAAPAPAAPPAPAASDTRASTPPAADPHASAPSSFAAGSLIIPMDTDTTGNHAPFNQNLGMWKAYGLVYRLLQNGVPVRWSILATKTATTDVDVSVSSVKDKRTGTALNAWDYRGGPFIVDKADAAAALPIITAWWAANGNQPNVHEALASFSADVDIILRHAPKIANEAINAAITIAYYNAAGIPDSNGKPWSTTSPDILDETEIAAGGLFLQGSPCLQRKYDVFVTPHNSGYSYSLSDPTNLGTKTYAQLDTFVQQGGGWTSLCHSITSNANAIADLTLNGSPAVKNMFKTSLPGGKPGGFLSSSGFSTVDNTGGAFTINPSAANLPVAQMVPTAVPQTLPGGSVQTWPAPGNPGAPTYWGNTERVATFDTAGVDHDMIVNGTYHDGTGLGKVTYIGGHSFSTAVPYSTNFEAPYLRAFYNSLYFNGSAVAKVDLEYAPGTYPINGTAPLSVSIVNSGGSVAKFVNDVSLTLEPGFTYVSTSAGPSPTVSGNTLTWVGGLGDVPGGQTAVTIQLAVAPSVVNTLGAKKIGQFHATYSDVYGENFTADLCREIIVSPLPAPRLTKTPSAQGPFTTGSTVSWTLTYGNTGTASLLNTLLQDTLPAGFAYISSSSSPSLGAPTVIPAASGTIVRWSTGTIAANTPSAGTVTIVARAPAVTNGTGDPLQQTFTNGATLVGKDAGGTSYSAAASADVTIQALDVTLGKTVDKTFLSTLPGTVTYTLTPRSSGNDILSNVRVIDPVPTGVTSPVAGQGGTVGPYVPIAAVPGADGNLLTSMTVSTNLAQQGGSVTVTLNVKNNASVANVSPSDLTIDGGSATCTGPTPASGTVPAGGAGLDFAWTCTLDDLGEYIFSASADDAAATTSWPEASSSSVLSVATGGPNVVTWNLGSNTAAVPGETLTGGFTPGIYGFRGADTQTFQKYGISNNAWTARANTPAGGTVKQGGALTTDGAGTIYGLRGDGSQAFWSYDIAGDAWTVRANTGTNVSEGGALVYLTVSGTKYVFATMGNGTVFKRYDVAANTWATMAAAPNNIKKGGALTTDGTNIYVLRGDKQKTFFRYNVATNTWTTLAPLAINVGWGGSLTFVGGSIYALTGDGKKNFYRYDIGTNTWTARASTPGNVGDGGALTTDGTNIYAFQGKTTAFWRYNVAANTWTVLAPYTAATNQGGALVFAPGVDPQGRFSSLSASRSLTVTGDTVKVTFRLTSSTAINNVTAGTLVTTATNGASCSPLSAATLTSPDDDIAGNGDAVTYEWTCTVAAGATPGSLTFSDSTSTGSGPVSFPPATSNSVIVSPPLTFSATVPIGAPNPVTDLALLIASGQTVSSPLVSTFSGQPNLTIVKSNTPGEGATVLPGDPITYRLDVQNTGTGVATGVVITDTVPANTVYTSCSGGTACSESGGTVTWTIGTLAPADLATVTFVVSASSTLPISATPYTISNTGSVDSDQTSPTPSNTVTNKLEVLPTILKTADLAEAGPGDTLAYTLNVSNPGAPFTADVTDAIPAGTTYVAGSCAPACTFASGTVTWSAVSIAHGSNTFSFAVTIDQGTAGTTITNTGTLNPTIPDLQPIDSNPADTEVGPDLGIVKFNNPTGQVLSGSTITYTLVVSNESGVNALNVVVTDPVPVGTSYVAASCTTPVGTCSESSGVVTFQLGTLLADSTVTVSFAVQVGTPPVGTLQIENQAEVSASNVPDSVPSNPVDNALPFPALVLTKSAAESTYDAVGDVIHYSYVVTNNSTTSTLAGPVTVTDDKAATVICPPGNLGPLASITCNATYTIVAGDLTAGAVTNTARAHAGATDSNFDQATVHAVGLSLVKTFSPTSVAAGSIGNQFTIAVTNTGTATINDVVVTDTIDPRLIVTAVTDNQTGTACGSPSQALSCTFASLGASTTATITVTYRVAADTAASPAVPNTATGSADEVGSTPSNTANVAITTSADLSVTKTDGVTTVVAGQSTGTYTITVTNNGPSDATAVSLTDTFPSGFSRGTVTPSQGTCTGSPSFTCALGTIAATGTATITVAYTVPAGTTGDQTNTASVTSAVPDPIPGNNSASDTDTVTTSADLADVKVDSIDPVIAGTSLSYTITVTNAGPSNATGVTVTDALDPALLFPTYTVAINGGPPSAPAAWTGSVGLGTLAPGDTAVIVISVIVDAATPPGTILSNTATVSSPVPDPVPANNTDTEQTTVAALADLSVTKTDGVTTVVAGQSSGTYLIVVTNAGPSDATAVSLTDTFPSGFSRGTVTPSQGTCTGSPSFTCDLGTIAATGSVTITVAYTVPAGTTGDQTNTVSVTSAVPDPIPGNNSASDTDTVGSSADLAITKTDGVTSVIAGTTTTYTVTVTNAGPTTVTGATVIDNLPPGATFVSATGGATFDAGTNTVHYTTGTLIPTGSESFTVTVAVGAGATGTLLNSATVSPPAGTADPNPANDTATDIDQITVNADLAVTKTDGKTTYTPGSVVTYTITVTNAGPSNAVGAAVSDLVPATLTGVTWTSTTAGSAAVTSGATGSGNTLAAVVNIAAGAGNSVTFTVTGTASPSATGNLVNTATVTAPAGTTDTDTGNNSATDTDTPAFVADLAIAKTDGSPTYTPGSGVTYTITVTNAGPSNVVGATVSDTIPATLTGVTWTSTTAGSAAVTSGASGSGNVLAAVVDIAAGAGNSVTFTVHGTASPSATGNLVNTVTVAPPAGTTDPVPGNDTATDTDTPNSVADVADVKVDSIDPVVAGTTLSYTITVTNAGPSDAANVIVTDTLDPALLTPTYTVEINGGGPSAPAPWTGSVGLGSVAPGTTIAIVISATVDPATPPDTVLSNTATVGSSTTDPNPANNTDTEETTVSASADLAVTKTDGVATVIAGVSSGTYIITVTNAGPSDATGVSLTDTFPAGFSRGAVTPSQGTCTGSPSFTCDLGTIAPSGSATVTVAYTVPVTTSGPQTNTASVTSDVTDPNPANDSASDTDAVEVLPAVAVDKTANPPSVPETGGSVTFTVAVTNGSVEPVTLTALVDDVHGDLDGKGTCDVPVVIAATATYTCSFTAVVSGNAGTIETDTVTATVRDAEQNETTGSDSAVVAFTNVAPTISATKTATPATRPEPGGTFTFGVTVHNGSFEPVTLLTLTDDVYGNLAGRGSCATGGTIAPNADYTCSFPGSFSGDAGASQTDTITATAADNDQTQATATAQATVRLTDVAPSIVVGKTVSPAVANLGDTVTFTVTVHNTSQEAVTLSGLTDSIHGNLNGKGTCATGGSIAAGATYTCSFTAVVTSTETDTVTGHVLDNEGTPGSDTASATVTVHPADVTIVKKADADTADAGDAIGFTVTVHNAGLGIARNVTVTDTLPTDVGLTWALDDDAGGACHLTGGTVTCGPADLAAGGSIVFHVTSPTTFATADASPVTNQACFATTNAGENCATDEVVVPQPPRSLTLAKTNNAPPKTLLMSDGTTVVLPTAQGGDTITYTLTYDVPDAPVDAVTITDVVPAGLAYVDGSATGSADGKLVFAGYDTATRTLSWTAAALSTSGSVTYRVTVLADAYKLDQPIANTAQIASEQTDVVEATSNVVVLPPSGASAPPTEAITPIAGVVDTPDSSLWLAIGGLVALIAVLAFIIPARPRVRRRKT